jgi:DNA-binding transcriptional LysR family regulator
MVPVCSPRHRLARKRRVATRALSGERWVAFPSRSSVVEGPYVSALAQTLAAAGLDASDIVPIDSLTTQKRMVEAGFGLALLPASSVDEELRAGTLRTLCVSALRIRVAVVLIHHRRAFQSGATRALVALLSDWG